MFPRIVTASLGIAIFTLCSYILVGKILGHLENAMATSTAICFLLVSIVFVVCSLYKKLWNQ